MNLFTKIKKKLFPGKSEDKLHIFFDEIGDAKENNNTEQKFRKIYGDEKFELQKLYEKWAVKESWLIKDQALPLLLGIEPGSSCLGYDVEIKKKIEDLWKHAKKCIEQGVLDITGEGDDESKWGIQPLEAYRWATIGRIPIPAELSALMDFIASTVNRKNMRDINPAGNHDNEMETDRLYPAREQVLGMALAILAAYPEQCRNSRGRIRTDKIVTIIEQKNSFWLGDNKLEITSVVVRDILDKWLRTLPEQLD